MIHWPAIVGIQLITIALCGATLLAAEAQRPPNIVMIVADDLGYADLGCFGSTFYETPHLDRLAATGMRFTNAYSTCPVCSPTRASIMTGRYPQRTGITDYINMGGGNQPGNWRRNTRLLPAAYSDRLALEERTIAEALREAGYATFFAGKWHLGAKEFWPEHQGFDINKGGTAAGSPSSYFSPYRNPRLSDGPPGEHLTMRLAEEASKFIAANADRPFFVLMPTYDVHVPLMAPRELVEKYEAKAARIESSQPTWANEGKNKVRLVQDHPTYAAMIESLDSAVGIVLKKLDDLDLTENTIVVFTADNGGLSTAEGSPTSNLPLRAGKGWLYEGGIRVPTIVRCPGFTAAGSTCATPISSIDYFPTFLQMAGSAEPENRVDGVSLVPLWRAATIESRALYWDYPHYGNQGGSPGSAIRDGRWKLIEWHDEGSVELYDLEADPGETKNLAAAQADLVARLRKSLSDWRREVGAKPPTPNAHYKPE
jgi:arylsulfatase A-like enzyme